ncbi:MAG: site-specific integrase [Terriglobales bacterium]
MRRRFQKGTLLKRGKKELLWVGRWLEDEVRTDGSIHRRHKSTVIGSVNELSKRQAQRELNKILEPINAGLRRRSHVIAFEEFSLRWKRDILIHHKASSQVSEAAHLSKWLLPEFGESSLCDIDSQAIQRTITKWSGLVAPKTIRNILATMRNVWKTARAWGYVDYDPFHSLMLPRRGLVRRPVLTPGQAKEIIRLADEPFKTLYWILAETGIRGGEVCGLFVEDVNLTDRLIHVRRSAWRGKLQTPKTENAIRTFPISPTLADHIAGHVAKRKSGLLFPTRCGTPYDNANIVAWSLKPLLKKIGITDTKRMGLHAFRHGNASALDSLGAPFRVRMDRLGHANSSTTLDYTHSNNTDHRRIAAEMGRIFCPS